MMRGTVSLFFVLVTTILNGCGQEEMRVDRNVAVSMRDGVVLRADVFRPGASGKYPVLIYRTPYDKHFAADAYQTHLRAVERGYVVVLQDVRGRYASDGFFNPYFNEGKDGYDTIEWAATQPWSNGDIGTFGLSYPGAVQWLAAVQSPPHLKAMAPAMTFSTPRKFFYMNGIWEMTWLPWIYFNIAPDARVRRDLPGPVEDAAVAAAWEQDGDEILSFLPLADLEILHDEAPFYFDWLRYEPTDPWWDWAEIRGRYHLTDAAVLNLSGWYDDAYGTEGAITNHTGLVAARAPAAARSQLILGPWQHGVAETGLTKLGELDFGPTAAIDYDAEILNFFDQHLKSAARPDETAPPIRYFVMGANEWQQSASWPPAAATNQQLCLGETDSIGILGNCDAASGPQQSAFRADPADPVMDPYDTFEPHDYQDLAQRNDLLIFETAELEEAVTVVGDVVANMYVSCDCADFDLWVRLLDVHPDGRAINLMSPGVDAQRVSYRNGNERQLLEPGEVVPVAIGGLPVANQFGVGHRIRIQVSASFAPYFSRNLQTGLSEAVSAESRQATITIHHGGEYSSALQLPVIE